MVNIDIIGLSETFPESSTETNSSRTDIKGYNFRIADLSGNKKRRYMYVL